MSLLKAPIPSVELPATEAFQEAVRLAGTHSEDVDVRGRFPSEAIEALRASEALSWYVPPKFGGCGTKINTLADATFELSRRCASTGMIFAMHQIQVASIVHHRADSRWFENYLRRLSREQRLIASATSEVGVGGNLRKSIAAIGPLQDSSGDLVHFEKDASTISYGAQADDLLTTVRRCPGADGGDQVMVLTHLDDMEIEQISDWDTLGMRGTCSPGFRIKATCLPDQVLPTPFTTIAAESMVPFSHILWANVWLGLCTDAFDRAQNFVRMQARHDPGITPPSALRLSAMSVRLAECRALIRAATREYSDLIDGECRPLLSSIGYAVRINNLKIAASEMAVDICQEALRVCGVLGYKNGGPYSVGRHLRDAYSTILMIANDRLHATNAALLLVHREGK